MTETRSTAVSTAAALIEGEACEPIWRIVQAELRRRTNDGGQVRPAVQRAVDALRAAALANIAHAQKFAHEHVPGAVENMPPGSIQKLGPDLSELISTSDMADRLGGITPQHARRLAAAAGITPIARNVWSITDVAHIAEHRRRTTHG